MITSASTARQWMCIAATATQGSCSMLRGAGVVVILSPCVKRLISRTMQGYVPSVAIAEAKRDRAARIQAQLQFYFGTLSEREIALYQHVYKVAYQRGYNRGMRRPPSRGALVPGQAA